MKCFRWERIKIARRHKIARKYFCTKGEFCTKIKEKYYKKEGKKTKR